MESYCDRGQTERAYSRVQTKSVITTRTRSVSHCVALPFT
jgi:hypothetical protein